MSNFKEVLERKSFDEDMERRNETLRRLKAPEIMAIFATHLNSTPHEPEEDIPSENSTSKENVFPARDLFSRRIDNLLGYYVNPIKFGVLENFYPIKEKPRISLTAETSKDFFVRGAPSIKVGTKLKLLWLETAEDNPDQLVFVQRCLRIIKESRHDSLVLRNIEGAALDYCYNVRAKNPEELLVEIIDLAMDCRNADKRQQVSLETDLI